MILHWSPRSPFVRKVDIAAEALGLGDRLTRVRSTVAMDRPNDALMRDNPLSKIPALRLDDGLVLCGSRLICRFLEEQAGGHRLFGTGHARWGIEARHALADGLTDVVVLWRNERDKPAVQRRPEWLSAFGRKVAATLDRFEFDRTLPETGLTIDRITLGCALAYLDYRLPEWPWRDGRPHLGRWQERFEAEPLARSTAPTLADDPGRQAAPR